MTVSGRRLFNLTTIMTVMGRKCMEGGEERRRGGEVRGGEAGLRRQMALSTIPDQCPQRSWSTRKLKAFNIK
jgi:hypothetical protein